MIRVITFPDIIPALAHRVRAELGSLFDPNQPVAVGFAPQCVDVIGGLLAGQGGPRCVMPVDRYAGVLVQPRKDRQVLIFDFDEYDIQRPFTLQMSIEALRNSSLDDLRKNLKEPGRQFAEPVIAAIRTLLELPRPNGDSAGINVGVHRQKGVVSGAASVVAATLATAQMIYGANVDEASLISSCQKASVLFNPAQLSALNVRAAFGSAVQWSASPGDTMSPVMPVGMPEDTCILTTAMEMRIDPQVLAKLEVAARMAHRLVLEKMRAFGKEAGRELISDPMGGKIGRLAMSDYKRFFRGTLPESIRGDAFITQFGAEGMEIDPEASYAPQFVADHLVIEAHRVREFVRHLEEACVETDPFRHKLAMDKAGHLLYASHKSARDNCTIGNDEADRLVDAVRANESVGLFGARLGSDCSTSAVNVLCRSKSMDRLREIVLSTSGVFGEILSKATLSACAAGLVFADFPTERGGHLDVCQNDC
jgi:galactokinase